MKVESTDQLTPKSDNLQSHSTLYNEMVTSFQVNVRRFEVFLYLLLLVHGSFILTSNDNSPILYGILGLLGLNLLMVLLDKRDYHNLKVLRALLSVGVAGILSTLAIDPSHMMFAGFFIITVYYSFALVPPYYFIVLFTILLVFTLTSLAIPQKMSIVEYLIRVGLMFSLSVLVRHIRMLASDSFKQRAQLMHDLQLVRDNIAHQLEERTTELQKEIQEREQAQNRLVEERQLLRTIIDTFPSRLFVKDRNSRFMLVNKMSLERLGLQDDPQAVVGKSDFDFYPHFAERTYADEQHIMATGEPTIDWEEMTQDDKGGEHHYLISKVPMFHPETNEIVGLVGVTTEVTTLKEAQIALRESEESLKLFQLRLKALNQITITLTRIESFDELVYQSVKQAVDNLGFTRISCRLIDMENSSQLLGGCRVDQDGEIVMTKYEVVTIPDDHPAVQIINGVKPNLLVRDAIIYDADWNPIGHGDKAFSALSNRDRIIGFLYTDSLLDDVPFSDSQFELLNLYSATLGAIYNRQQTQEALRINEEEARYFQQQLKRLNEITIELESFKSLDDLCYHAVTFGREKLGFDRIGIWLADENNPDMRHGVWGTDRHGNIRDERGIARPVPSHEIAMILEGDIVALRDHDIVDIDGSLIRVGWNMVGLMWDGEKRIGWIYADNALQGLPLTPNQHELFRLYAATIGLLCVRQIADEQLRQSEIRYRAITEASSDIILIVNQQSEITYVSQSLKIVMGVDPQAIIGRSVAEQVHSDDVPVLTELFQECLQTPNLNTRMDEFRARHADGHWIHMEAVITSMIDNPIINGILVSCRDLTHRLIADERKRIVERERERASVLRQFISDISHDFRTPLSTISTNAYLLIHGRTDLVDTRIEMINQQVERIAKLLDNMNKITKLDETSQIKMEKVNINSILESIPYDRGKDLQDKHLTLTLELQDHLQMITGNLSLLHDAVYHVIDNAIQFCKPDDSIMVQSSEDQDYVTIQISDTGGGIAEGDMPFIFDRLYRADKARSTQTGGSGLGLAITRRIVDLHQGDIEVSSQLDEGTTIYIRFPCQPIHSKNIVDE